MSYLNYQCIEGLSDQAFKSTEPYPWANIEGTLTPEGFEALRATLPDVTLFERRAGLKRGHGQAYHDRYMLHYNPGLALSQAWRDFIAELSDKRYESFMRRMLGLRANQPIILTLDWFYAWQGCDVSPHCDARRKIGTHIFYFNTDEDWDTSWGGNVLIMDDQRRYKRHSAPQFDDLKVAASLDPRGNGSLLFARTEHSWHGVRPLQCPDGRLRKLFLVTVNSPTLQVWWRRLRGKDPDGYPLVHKAA